MILGVLLGHFKPDWAVQMQPLGDAFIRLVKMIIAPIIFLTVAVGIAKLTGGAGVGRIGLKAILYFEVLTTVAMVIGLLVGHFFEPGAGVNADPTKLSAGGAARYIDPKAKQTITEFLINIIPDQVVNAFAKGDILPILMFAVLFGVALAKVGRARLRPRQDPRPSRRRHVRRGRLDHEASRRIGAFGAMAFAIGRYGIGTLGEPASI